MLCQNDAFLPAARIYVTEPVLVFEEYRITVRNRLISSHALYASRPFTM